MSYLYVDESIHERGDFIVIAAVYCDHPLDNHVFAALEQCGFTAGHDEFKSCLRMSGDVRAQQLREKIQNILWEHCRVAYAACSVGERHRIADHTYLLVEKLTWNPPIKGGTIYFDQGIRPASAAATPVGWDVLQNCDSRSHAGIQVADCAAHTFGTILLDRLGINQKIVPIENYVEPEVELRWLLWSWLRDAMASNIPAVEAGEDGWQEPWMLPFGNHVSDLCSDQVRAEAEFSLGIWLGCIH